MIFVTVGTHEQAFDRLVRYIDELKANGVIEDEVVIQTGYCTYEPQHCTWDKFYPYQKMVEYVAQARIVVTHGGPSSFIMPFQVGKIPVVVPRQKKFDEHVNDHQLDFAKEVQARQGNMFVVEDIEDLKDILLGYETLIEEMPAELKSNNARFTEQFAAIVDEMLV